MRLTIEMQVLGEGYRIVTQRPISFDNIATPEEIESLDYAASQAVLAAVRNIAHELQAANDSKKVD